MLGIVRGAEVSLRGRLLRISYIERAADALKSSRVGGGDERPSYASAEVKIAEPKICNRVCRAPAAHEMSAVRWIGRPVAGDAAMVLNA